MKPLLVAALLLSLLACTISTLPVAVTTPTTNPARRATLAQVPTPTLEPGTGYWIPPEEPRDILKGR